MRSRRARIGLIAFLAVVILATVALVWRTHADDGSLRARQRDLLDRVDRLSALVDDIDSRRHLAFEPRLEDELERRAAEVPSLIERLSEEASALEPLTRSNAATTSVPTIIDATNALMRVDARARQDARNPRAPRTADLEAEGRDIVDAIRVELRGIRTAETQAHEAARGALMTQAAGALSISALLLLGGLALLARAPRVEDAPLPAQIPEPPALEPEPADPPTPSRGVDLPAAAALCRELSLLPDAAALPAALGRGASLIQASGLVVWVAADGALVPAAAHGYQPAVLGSWGRITSGDDNLTARAWRTANVQAVTVEEGLAALAVPLVDRDGCFGVLAAELTPQTGTNADDVRAVMTVLAAQLSSIVSRDTAAEPAPALLDPPLEATGG